MKIIIGLLLVATSLAYPLAENEEKPSLPLVIQDQSPVAQQPEILTPALPALPALPTLPAQASSETSSSEESKESSEKLPQPKPSEEPASDEKPDSSEEKQQNETPKDEEKKTDEQKPGQLKEEIKEDAKASVELPTVPTIKLLSEEPKIEQVAPVQGEVVQIIPKSILPIEQPVVEQTQSESQDKPLALPALKSAEKPLEETQEVAATEIKEEIVLPSEQKVEIVPAAEEKTPKLKAAEILPQPAQAEVIQAEPAQPEVIQPVELKSVPVEQVVEAVQKPESEKRAKSEEPKPEEKPEVKLDAPKPEEPKPEDAKVVEPLPAQEKPVEIEAKKPEGKAEEIPAKPLEEPKPTVEAKTEQKAEEPKPEQQEKLPEPSASSS